MSAPMLRHTVEFGATSVAVSERVADNTKLEDIKIPFTKGQMVCLKVDEWKSERGLFSARGNLELVTPSPANGEQVGGGRKP